MIILITGTSKGIGYFLANHYLDNGHTVIGCSRSTCHIDHPQYTHFSLDITDEKAVKAMFSAIRKSHGQLDVLVNNAGVAVMNHALLTPKETAVRLTDTNLIACFICCREAAKLMRKKRFGRIVNFSTVAVPLSIAGEALYAASKSGVEAFSKVFAKEVAEFGITVNTIGPTPIETDLIKSVPEEKIQALIAQQGIQRMGTYQDVSNLVDFYISPSSDFITGQCIYLGGV